jgi:putative photosynthetic complex assembly protein
VLTTAPGSAEALEKALQSRARDMPRPVLYAAGALVCASLIAAIAGRMAHVTTVPQGVPVLAVRHLQFTDRADKGVDVIDADRHTIIRTVTGQAGFLRGTMRGLASARIRAGLDLSTPFTLTAYKDNRLTLDDPTDKRHVELEAFGPSNEAVFADLLRAPEPPK